MFSIVRFAALTLPLGRQRRPEAAKGGGDFSVVVIDHTSPLAGEVGVQRRVGGWRGAPKGR